MIPITGRRHDHQDDHDSLSASLVAVGVLGVPPIRSVPYRGKCALEVWVGYQPGP